MSIITDRDEIMNIRERISEIADKITKKEGLEKLDYYGKEYKVLKKGVGDINNNTYIYYILLNGTQLCYSYANNNPNSPYFNNLLQTPLPLIRYKVDNINLRYIDLLNTLYTETVDDTKIYAKIGSPQSGGKRTAPSYKLNGEKVHLLINKKKIYRSVYVKGNGKAKYCKINYEFVLLSKLKNKII
jgi:hypothetical protein